MTTTVTIGATVKRRSWRSVRGSISLARMAEETSAPADADAAATIKFKKKSLWPSVFHWIPTFTDHIIAAKQRLLRSLVGTPYTQEQVNIGSGPPDLKDRASRASASKASRSRPSELAEPMHPELAEPGLKS
ncbi:hypothetical protein F0562_019417 [Nyssa sinensis]|uniref:Uncharacterized protein n=1 Tax=Nyssa sinensis TaxID=561372 RepID=A0A5J4ZFD3_9ASTE|nr:hypothetical protein F0562_019417 [Nyssa sinensis]